LLNLLVNRENYGRPYSDRISFFFFSIYTLENLLFVVHLLDNRKLNNLSSALSYSIASKFICTGDNLLAFANRRILKI
jgi:hypothetical protein